MSRGKWLGELISRDEVFESSNTLIISPCGSGKTYFIFNELIQRKDRVLYLCDNTNLKIATLKNNNKTTEKHDKLTNLISSKNVEVMTYKKFGITLRKMNFSERLKDYDFVIADEIHNLLDYENFNGDGDLGRVISMIFNKQIIPIVMMTATPYYLKEAHNQYNQFLRDIKVIDFMDNEEINRYIDIRRAYISHISQIQYEFRCYKQLFKLRDGKCLVFCPNISQMKMIEEMAANENLKAISVWSENNKDNPMTDEQIEVRDLILTKGVLKNDYDILIINRALETGVNIVDKRFRLFISCSSNITQTVQSRNRLRMDMDVVILKSSNKNIPNNFFLKLDPKWLNKPLTFEDIDELLTELNIKDAIGRPLGVSKLCDILVENDYEITYKRTRINGKQKRCRIITEKNI